MTLRNLFLSLALTLSLAIAPALGQNSTLKSNPQLLAVLSEVVTKPSESTVRIRCDGSDAALGTIVAADGWIVTKYSELKGDCIVKFKDNRELPAKVVGVHVAHDLAMLKVEAKSLPVAEWRDSKENGVGSWVASAGLGKEPVAIGVISVAARSGIGGPRISPNENGGYLGVQMEPTDGGVRVEVAVKGGPADKAGLKKDDVISAIDGIPVTTNDDILEFLGAKKPKDEVTLSVVRDKKPMELTVELGKRPPDVNRGEFQNKMGGTLSKRRMGFPSFLQHDTVLTPSDCGGPLVDLDGKVIGINIARAGRTESYAIPSETVKLVLDDLKSGKLPPPKPLPVSTTVTEIKQLEASIKKTQAEIEALEKKKKEIEEKLKKLKEKK